MLPAFDVAHQNSGFAFPLTEKTRFITILYPNKEETQKMKRTFQPNNRKRNKNHGFLVRMRSKGGRRIIKNRRRKGRTRLAV
jgi:large subunit ribosomal protein L34